MWYKSQQYLLYFSPNTNKQKQTNGTQLNLNIFAQWRISLTKWKEPAEREKIFANNMTNEGLISKVYKTAHTTQYQMNILIKKWAEKLKRQFSKEEMQIP